MTVIVFGLVVLVAMLLHAYLWFRLARSSTRPGRARRRLTVLTAALAVLPTAAVIGRSVLPWSAQAPRDWVAYTLLGLAVYTSLALLVLEPVRWLLLGVQRRRESRTPGGAPPVATNGRTDDLLSMVASSGDSPLGGPGAGSSTSEGWMGEALPDARPASATTAAMPARDLSRRLFLARSLAVAAGAVAVTTAGTGAVLANSAPVVRRVPVSIAGLDPALVGYRIVTFSDAHLSTTYGGRRFERLVETVNAQVPDVVAVVGDLVDGEVADLREEVAPLADLVSNQGAYFVTGNHEYLVDTDAWLRHLPKLGVDVLRNERVTLGRGGATFDLAGIDDRTAARSGLPGHGANLDAALDGRDADVSVVLLAHQPFMVDQARAAGVDLQLSGHTHGGQLWPFDYAIRLDQPAVEGLSRHGDTQLYVTAGAGYWGPPMRIGARPEVTVLELTRA
ncbi:putative MPP superfamily phosphohydrolase [Geodermatophilus bullaregiensis]|uniref:metallophosphoesterase n=1 Tax=Geodermatophilus bullaregiensis TaxID=1564160 RepID=UPI0027DE9C62|nr:metallophosphoesterase [Geodermatophilus bullaregiensis]MBM7808496.1 putative MPP superfamily phosphohydrolase [Geodermatophilus bullaregiensis]